PEKSQDQNLPCLLADAVRGAFPQSQAAPQRECQAARHSFQRQPAPCCRGSKYTSVGSSQIEPDLPRRSARQTPLWYAPVLLFVASRCRQPAPETTGARR